MNRERHALARTRPARRRCGLFRHYLGSTIFLAEALMAGPMAPASITRLISEADTVIVARIERGTVFNGVASVTLNVERTLKGSAGVGTAISLIWKERTWSITPSRALHNDRALFFLRREPNGDWRVLPAMGGQTDFEDVFFLLPSGPQPPEFKAPAGTSSEDKVFLELAWVTAVGKPAQRGAIVNLPSSYRGSESKIVREAFNRFAQSSSDRLAKIGIRGAVSAGSVSALSLIEQQQQRFLTGPWASEVVEEMKFYYKNPDREGVRTLGRLATANETRTDLRLAGAAALARLHTRDCLPYLAQLLDSPNLTLRTYAVGGLAMFANNVPIGSHHPAPGAWSYRTDDTISHSAMDEGVIARNEPYYVCFWKEWWSQHRLELSQ